MALPTKTEQEALLATLEKRFKTHTQRHPDLDWTAVQKRVEAQPKKMGALYAMEITGGEPDVVGIDESTGEFLFYDCAPESPKGRRSLCYDPEALESRKKFKPKDSALGMAAKMGVQLLTETEYRQLQELGPVDTKTSSWIATPKDIREKGGALFGDYRFGRVFTYHNGAESYYAARGFRAVLRV